MVGVRSLLWALLTGKEAWLGGFRSESSLWALLGPRRLGETLFIEAPSVIASVLCDHGAVLTLWEGHEGRTMPPPGALEAQVDCYQLSMRAQEAAWGPWDRERDCVDWGGFLMRRGIPDIYSCSDVVHRREKRAERAGENKEGGFREEPRRGLESHSAHVTSGSWSWRTVRPFLGSWCRRIALSLRSAWAAEWNLAHKKTSNKQTDRQNLQRGELRNPQRKCTLVRGWQTWSGQDQCSSLPLGKQEVWAFPQSI